MTFTTSMLTTSPGESIRLLVEDAGVTTSGSACSGVAFSSTFFLIRLGAKLGELTLRLCGVAVQSESKTL